MRTPTIALDRDRLAEFCRRNSIRRLALFGSALREDFHDDSDLDLLVEFEPGTTPGLAFFGLQDDLSTMLGHTVDLNTSACLSPLFRDEVATPPRCFMRPNKDQIRLEHMRAATREAIDLSKARTVPTSTATGCSTSDSCDFWKSSARRRVASRPIVAPCIPKSLGPRSSACGTA